AGEGGGAAALLVPDDPPGGEVAAVAAAVAEGATLGTYRFDAYRSTPGPPCVERLVVVGRGGWEEGLRRGAAAAAATAFARDLANTPAGDLTPRLFAGRVQERLAGLEGTTVEVWEEGRIAQERLGGVLAVARGSAEPPRLVRATYTPPDGWPDGAVPHVVLVGKGITFDSGGLSLKPAEAMMTMKTDMSGAAIVLAVLSACADLRVPVKVTAIAPMSENMPGGRALRPGDVFTARNGGTVEVLNTDAEGRLVLADALSMATELAPDAIVDVATLTGAQVIALGKGMAALLGNDRALMESLREAGDRAGERFWPLPLPDDYREHISSEIADMKNIGRAREAGTIAAALLLARFVGDVPWAHLDIAGPARSEETSGYMSKGATAFGVRALLDFLAHYPTQGPPG
ncbi:MAG: leucyl aminopeptidase, partial [Acidimicrobiales bacterium]